MKEPRQCLHCEFVMEQKGLRWVGLSGRTKEEPSPFRDPFGYLLFLAFPGNPPPFEGGLDWKDKNFCSTECALHWLSLNGNGVESARAEWYLADKAREKELEKTRWGRFTHSGWNDRTRP